MTAALTPLRLTHPPALEPPYDDEHSEHRSLPLTRIRRNDLAQPRLPYFSTTSAAGTDSPIESERKTPFFTLHTFSRQSTPRQLLPEPGEHARRLVQALMEVMAGQRRIEQLVSWLHESLYFKLVSEYGTARCASRPPRMSHNGALTSRRPRAMVTNVHSCEPADGVAEVSAVVRERDRAYAVALRLEGLDGSWRCTSLTLV